MTTGEVTAPPAAARPAAECATANPAAAAPARRGRDGLGLAAVAAAGLAVTAPLVAGGPLLGMDAATQFVPWYAHLGERLRAGDVPAWNPHVFAGAPFAADPLSGWGYLPAMLLFAALPVGVATAAYLVVSPLLAGVGAYLLARALRLPVVGAVVAGVVAETAGVVAVNNPCCFAYTAVAAWLPWALLGAQVAVGARSRRTRWRGWALGALAVSQILAAWPGQGSLYALTVVAAWIAWRTLVAPDDDRRGMAARLRGAAADGVAVLGLGAALGAAALLPRLELNAVSTLAGGYPPGLVRAGGWTPQDWWRLLRPGRWHVGIAALALAAAAPLLGRRRRGAARFFALTAVVALAVATTAQTPLHRWLATLPGAGRVVAHAPERVLVVLPLAVALLAGTTVAAIAARSRRGAWFAVSVAVVVAGQLVAADLVALHRLTESPLGSARLARTDPGGRDPGGPDPDGSGSDLAAAFLRRAAGGAAGGRFVGYGPQVAGGRVTTNAYSVRWADPRVAALGVNNTAMSWGLATTQGYNPTRVARYDELVAALNGGPQNYHFADVRRAGLRSGLLDLLAVRWLVVPDDPTAADPSGVGALTARHPTVLRAGGVRVLERRSALPRAWLVHDARRVARGGALPLLASGAVDPATTVLLEGALPPLAAPADPTADRVDAADTADDPDTVSLRTSSDAAAVLVLSEVAYPAWRATVDGRPAEVLVADHALRAVAVGAGDHVVTLRYASSALPAGIALTAITAFALLVAALPGRWVIRCHRSVSPRARRPGLRSRR